MKIKFAKKWVRALRSGKYKQGMFTLERVTNSGSAYCCLGVLCRITKAPRLTPRALSNDNRVGTVFYGKNFNNTALLPIEVVKQTGMRTRSGHLGSAKCGNKKNKKEKEKDDGLKLTDLNDGEGYTFDEIADCIDAMIYGGIINEL